MSFVVVNFELDVRAAGRDATGAEWQAPPTAITKLPRRAGQGAVEMVQYESKLFRWDIRAESDNFGSEILGKVNAPLCFRFDQARLSSNLHPKEIPLRIWRARQGHPQYPKWRIDLPRGTRFVTPPAFCFHGSTGERFFLAPDLSELFPSGKMFNVSWQGRDTNLTDRGIGNWLKIHVPIEYEGNREELEVTLTAIESRAWLV